jgi:hypothetical protein
LPNPDRLLHTLQQANAAFRATPGRRGRLVALPDGAEVLVAGDLHGNIENFRRLLQVAALGLHARRHLLLQELIHGPHRYGGGGDKSHQLLDLVAALKCQFPHRVHLLLGNHELAQWTGQGIAKEEGDLDAQFRQGITTAYGTYAPAVYEAYRELFAVVPLALRTVNRIFLSHSLPSARRQERFDPAILERDQHDPEDLRPGGMVHALLWGRNASAENAAAFLRKVDADLLITGHIPCEKGFAAPNEQQIILDCLGEPACYCLFPTDRPITQAELLEYIHTL